MTLKSNKLRDAIAVAIAMGAVAAMGHAFAQDPAPAAPAQETKTTELDRIEVTGSRIKRVDIETSQPVLSLSRQQIQSQGLTSIGDILQNISTSGSALNTTINNGGSGETNINLRNLGSSRTLVLVNGRRWVGGTGLGGAVDLNTIPTAAVERIEVLKDGASTIYGSDAIAGVVNIILRQDFDGAEANAYIGTYDKGDGARQSYDFLIGSNGERWSAMLGVGFVKEEPVWARDRKISAVPVYGSVPGIGYSSTTPDGRFGFTVRDPETGEPIPGSTRPDGSPGYFIPQNGGKTWRNYTTADAYNHATANYLLTPQERKSVFADASLNITENVRFKTTVTYNERESAQVLAAMPIVLGQLVPGTNGANIVISRNNIYNQTGRDIDYIQYRAAETGGRIFNQNVKTYGFNGAFEGNFDVGSRLFDWEVGMFYGKNDRTDITNGLFNISALRNALGPSFYDATGVARCGTSSAIIDGCVPMNMLNGAGSLTPEMINYASFTAHDVYGYEQKTYYANIGGEIFELPGGPLAFSFGVERRSESGFDDPDALINGGDTTGNARTATKGGYSLDEAYLEFAVPLLADMPGAQLLDFSLATRYSKYSTFGDTLNSKFGFRWKPIDDLMIRGNWSEGFRAPSVNDLFAGVGDTFEQTSDPCAARYGDVPNRPPASCAGVPPYNQDNSQIRTTVGGNPLLDPERSVSKTLGFVYSPAWVQGLDLSVDWWNIKIEDAIDALTAQETLDACYRIGNPEYCAKIERDPNTGIISNLLAVAENVASMRVEGYDIALSYRLPESAWGNFSLISDSTYVTDYYIDNVVTLGTNRVGNYRGGSALENYWRLRSTLALAWEYGDFGATAGLRYFSRQNETCDGSNFADPANFDLICSDPDRVVDSGPAPRNKIPSVTYTDIAGYVNTPWNARVTLGINNAFDRDPPFSATTFANSFDPQYEVPGRFLYMRYTQKF